MSDVDENALCHACGGRQGECVACGSTDYCVHVAEDDHGYEDDYCVVCLGTYHAHKFTVAAEE